jgi:hypothetical protein
MQTLRKRKVAGARENKWPQLLGGFVFMASAFPRESALLWSSRYPEKTISTDDTVDLRCNAVLQSQRAPHIA